MKNIFRHDAIEFFLRLHRQLIIFALLYLVFQFIPFAILPTAHNALSSQLRSMLILMLCLSFPPLFVYQMILSRGPGGVMYYAHAINMMGILLVMSKGHFTYTYSQTLALAQILFLHPGPLMVLFTAIEYLLFKSFLKRAIRYRYLSLFWTLGPILYIIMLIPTTIFVIKAFTTPSSYAAYHFPLQLGYAAWVLYYAVPGPFISLMTLPKYLQFVKSV